MSDDTEAEVMAIYVGLWAAFLILLPVGLRMNLAKRRAGR